MGEPETRLLVPGDDHVQRKRLWVALSGVGAVAMCFLVLAAVLSYRDKLSSPIPSECTRLEFEYYPSVAEHLHQWFRMSSDLFDSAEMQMLRSRGPFVVNDQITIEFLSRMLRSRLFLKGQGRTGGGDQYIKIRCYRNGEHVVTLTLYKPDLIVTDDGRRFQNKAASYSIPTGELSSLTSREACARNLYSLYRFKFEGIGRQYPSPAKWSDEVSAPMHRDRRRGHVNVSSPVANNLSCYSASDGGKCHYAMNPDCKPNSPPDTVLLFETRGGWNQHGGPELFTFDNHDPKGGLVLLNDGTVKFIRTEEELKQLRWK